MASVQGRPGLTREKEAVLGTGGRSAKSGHENSETKRPLAELTQAGEPDQGEVQGRETREMVVLTDRDRMAPRGPDKDQGRTDRVRAEARLARQGPEVVRGRTGLGRTDRRGEEVSEEATFRREWVSCLSE